MRLLRRHWFIFDACQRREVKGDGVVGEQPTLAPGDIHKYMSATDIRSGVGKMLGYYTMERLDTKELVRVRIPSFTMLAPYLLN